MASSKSNPTTVIVLIMILATVLFFLKPIGRFFSWLGLTTQGMNSDAAFLDALRQGDEAAAEQYIEAGANPNVRMGDITPLSVSSEYATTRIFKKLIDAGADVNQGNLLLQMCAARSDRFSEKQWTMVKLLVDAKADLNAKDTHGRTALWFAYRNEFDDLIRYLLAAGAADEPEARRAYTLLRKLRAEGFDPNGSAAAEILALPHPENVNLIIDLKSRTSGGVEQQAVDQILQRAFGSRQELIPFYLENLDSYQTGSYAREALLSLGDKAVPPLINELLYPTTNKSETVKNIVVQMGSKSAPALYRMLDNGSREEQVLAVDLMSRFFWTPEIRDSMETYAKFTSHQDLADRVKIFLQRTEPGENPKDDQHMDDDATE